MDPIYFNSRSKLYREFSNFYPSSFVAGLLTWPTVEHYYQACKSTVREEREWVRVAKTPWEAKRRGRLVILRPDWEEFKELVMLTGLRYKFQQSALLRDLLLSTRNAELHEDMPNDKYWGYPGKDRLGKLLMQVRTEFMVLDRKDMSERASSGD